MTRRDGRQRADAHGRRPPGPPPEATARGAADVPDGGHPADCVAPVGTRALGATKAVGRGIGKAAVVSIRGAARGSRFAASTFRSYANAGGAGDTGLARLTELHLSHAAGDAAMALALAGTLFLNPQTVTARSQVTVFLLVAMVPYVLVAPFIGPLLDRFSHGRRWAIGTTMATRGFLCWVMAEAIYNNSSWLFPSALAYLVASKAYQIARAAAVPRLLPSGTTLVNANSKISVAGVIGALIGGGIAAGAMKLGAPWALRAAFVIFVIGTIQAIRLPAAVDDSAGEISLDHTQPIGKPASGRGSAQRHTARSVGHESALEVDSTGFLGRFLRRLHAIPWPVRHAMWTTGGTRLLTGFLIMFMAFLAKERPINGMRGELVLAIVVIGIGVGNALGSVLGNVVHAHRPERVAMLSVLAATLVCILAAVWYDVWTLVALGLVQGLAAQLASLCLDALVQREVPENVRASVFGWSETMLQTLWVAGGALGIVLPLNPHVGFPLCALALVFTVVMAARQRRVGARGARPTPRAAH